MFITFFNIQNIRDCSLYEQIWDPYKARTMGCIDYVHNFCSHNRKETAFPILHDLGYHEITEYFKRVYSTNPLDGSDWSSVEKDLFHRLICATGKDIHRVSKHMGKSIANCLCYYYGTFKSTADYARLKRLMKKNRLAEYQQDETKNNSTLNEDEEVTLH